MKSILAQTTGLEPERQRLFFRGKEKSDREFLHTAGVKDGAKLLLLEKPAPANIEQKVEPVVMDESMMKACEAVARVRAEVDKLSAKVKEHSICCPYLFKHSRVILFLVLMLFLL